MTGVTREQAALNPAQTRAVEDICGRWELSSDGDPFVSLAGVLAPVAYRGQPAMLKIAHGEEEQRGAHVMVWWAGNGAARVLAHEGDALLLERAAGTTSLAAMVRDGRDDEASRILCAAAARLHAPRIAPLPETLVPLWQWFAALHPAAETRGGVFRKSAAAARQLLAEPREIVVLHGDLHHGNVLDFGPRDWLAIDPKGLVGERGFEFANIFCNPDAEIATAPGRLERQATVVAEAAGLDRQRVLLWVLAYAGLSAAWSIEDGDDPALALAVAARAAWEIGPV